MKIKNDYDRTLTNIAASAQQYFGLNPTHKTLSEVDCVLEKYHPRNVVVVLLDGLGGNILDRSLPEQAFLRRNRVCNLTTVFPATTAAATTSIRTGLNPVEHGFVGWTAYIEPIDKVITLFQNTEKGKDDEICEEFLKVKDLLVSETITDQINQSGRGAAIEILPFGDDAYDGFDDMTERIAQNASKPGRHFIYAYDEEPDTNMHKYGPFTKKVRRIIRERDEKLARLASQLHDTLMIVIADHGHIKTRTIYLENYPDILALMAHKTSIDQRATVYKIKPGKKQEFRRLFEKSFGDYYELYSAEEVYKSGLFGDGKENPLFHAALGDYLAIAISDVAITAPGDHYHVSHHAGYTDDEVLVPLIMKYIK